MLTFDKHMRKCGRNNRIENSENGISRFRGHKSHTRAKTSFSTPSASQITNKFKTPGKSAL